MTTIGLIRLVALDVSVVEQRLTSLSELLPEVDTISLVCKQPALLRRDVDGSLRPRLLFLSSMLGDPAEATRVVVSNPRLLMSSWGVLARLAFVLTHVTGGLRTIGVSSTIMTPKAAFATRFPLYTKWLHAQIEYQAKAIDALRMASAAEAVAETEDDAAAAEARLSAGIVGRQKPKRVSKRSPGKLPPTTASVAQLETRLGDLLEERLDPQLCEGGLSLTSFDGAFTEAVFDPDVEGAGYMTLGLK